MSSTLASPTHHIAGIKQHGFTTACAPATTHIYMVQVCFDNYLYELLDVNSYLIQRL